MANIETDEQFTETLNELQSLLETIELLQEQVADESQRTALLEPMKNKFDLLQESATRYFDEHKDEETL